MPGIVPSNPSIFHITHVANLANIIADGCLWSDAQRLARGVSSTNIGISRIKQRRLNRVVGVGGKLGDYVPFNFCSRSVMLCAVWKGHENYTGGQDEIVHLVSSVQTATALGRPWAFTDRHADLGYALFFNSLTKLIEVDWNVMPLTYWGNRGDGTKERRQAEFLVHDAFPWSAVEQIGVKSSVVATTVHNLLAGRGPAITIRPDWYY